MRTGTVIIIITVAVLCAIPFIFGDSSTESDVTPATITVFGAASLGNVIETLAGDFERSCGIRANIDFASSGILRAKIVSGADPDVFLSASAVDVDLLLEKGLVSSDDCIDLLSNRLVCIVQEDSIMDVTVPEDLLDERILRIAVGDPEHVPAGFHTKEALVSMDLWGRLYDKIIPCADVRSTLAHIELGTVDAAIVYQTDALIGKNVKTAFKFPLKYHSQITYVAAVLKQSRNKPAAQKFIDFLTTANAANTFAEHGFQPFFRETN